MNFLSFDDNIIKRYGGKIMDTQTYRRYITPFIKAMENSTGRLYSYTEDGEDNYGGEDEVMASVESTGAMPIKQEESDIHCITVIGQIEGHMVLPPQNKTTKYEHIIPQLIAVEESKSIKGLLMILNTVGGDVEAGLALAELISTMSKPVVSLVLGGGHSIGVPLALSARHSVIASTAAMTIHPIRMNGLFIGSPQTYDYMNKMQERIIGFVTEHSEISRDKFTKLMLNTGDVANEIGTVVVGEEAVKYGLIDEVGGIDTALSRLRQMINGGQPS